MTYAESNVSNALSFNFIMSRERKGSRRKKSNEAEGRWKGRRDSKEGMERTTVGVWHYGGHVETTIFLGKYVLVFQPQPE